jgi:hypothetical protein
MSISNKLGCVLVLAAAAAAAGCGDAGSDAQQVDAAEIEQVGEVSSSLVASGSGTVYRDQCVGANVPVPPDFSTTTTTNGTWVKQGQTVSDGFANAGIGTDVYMHVSTNPNTPGRCAIAAHFGPGEPFSVLCQGANGKACFWESNTQTPFPTATPVVIAGSSFPGGTALTSRCTVCHMGQNAFITHNMAGHPLNRSDPYWMTSGWYEPILPAGWTNDGPSTTNYPPSCTTCHSSGGVGGGLPNLQSPQLLAGGDNYCSILRKVTNIPASQGGMPPNSTCSAPDAPDCPAHNDPYVQVMLAACGQTIPIATTSATSPVALGAFTTASQFNGRWDHIYTGTYLDITRKSFLFDNVYVNGTYQGWNPVEYTSTLPSTSRATMWPRDNDGSRLSIAVNDSTTGTIRERQYGLNGGVREVSSTPAAGSPFAYIRHDGANVVVFRGTDNAIYEAYWTGVSWSTQVLPGPKGFGDPVGYARGTTSSVIYKCGKQLICELRLNEAGDSTWKRRTIPTSVEIRGTTMPMPFKRAWSSEYHIFYAGADGLHVIYDFQEPSFGYPDDYRVNSDLLSSSPSPYNPQDSGVRVAYIVDPGGTNASRLSEAVKPYGSWDWVTYTHVSPPKSVEALEGDPWAFQGTNGRNTIVFRNSAYAFYQLQTVNGSMGNVPYAKTIPRKGFNTDTSGSVTQAQETRWSRYLPAGKYKLDLAPSSGDSDLYVRVGGLPTTTTYDCRPYASGVTAETCTSTVTGEFGGTIYFMVRGYAPATSSYTLKAYHIE